MEGVVAVVAIAMLDNGTVVVVRAGELRRTFETLTGRTSHNLWREGSGIGSGGEVGVRPVGLSRVRATVSSHCDERKTRCGQRVTVKDVREGAKRVRATTMSLVCVRAGRSRSLGSALLRREGTTCE